MGTGTTLTDFLDQYTSHPTQTYPEFRSLIGAMADVASFQTGSVTGTGVALDVATRGNPRVVIVINSNSGTMGIKTDSMATSSAFKLNATGPAVTFAAANMVTLGTDKFTIGNDAQLNTAHTLHWLAIL